MTRPASAKRSRVTLPPMLLGGLATLALAGCGPVRTGPAIPPGSVAAPCRPASPPTALARAPIDDGGSPLPPVGPVQPPPSFATILAAFCGYDINRDGTPEINSLTPLFAGQEPYTAAPNGVAIVFVEPRLVADDPANGVTHLEMMARLDQLRQDLSREGFFAYFVLADVYAGTRHQDGRTLLAMRRFLQSVYRYYPLKSTLLIGSFPDAAIVWTFLTKERADEDHPEQFTSGSNPLTNYVGAYLSIYSQLVTPRGEIVLADLDGNWERLYREHVEVTDYKAMTAAPPATFPFDGQVVHTGTFAALTRPFDDVFHIVEHNAVITRTGGSLVLELGSLDGPSPEATAADQAQPNRIARPEIAVGRINPKSIAIAPYTGSDDRYGHQPLDASGTPQLLSFNYPNTVRWRLDPTLERRLIADYLGRAHAFRLGRDHDVPLRVSSIRGPDDNLTSPAGFDAILRKAFAASTAVGTAEVDNADPEAFVRWLKTPAVLRGIAAHSDAIASSFADHGDARSLEIAVGAATPGKGVWRWYRPPGDEPMPLTPSFEGMTTVTNFHLYRTIWENRVLAGAPQTFFVHDGCEVMRFSHSDTRAYNDPTYGQADDLGAVTNGESLMFYANGLGLMARNKVFNDTPNGFSEAIRASGGRFGYGWMGYFYADAADPALDERAVDSTGEDRRYRTLQRKRSYFWNMIGDPTLKLHY